MSFPRFDPEMVEHICETLQEEMGEQFDVISILRDAMTKGLPFSEVGAMIYGHILAHVGSFNEAKENEEREAKRGGFCDNKYE